MDANSKLEALKKFYSEMGGKDYFELLGVGRETTDDEVRSAYFGLMKQFGADYFRQVTDEESRKAVDEVNRELRAAYDAIGKAAKRAEYIASLSGRTADNTAIDFESVFKAEQAVSQAVNLIERGEFNVAKQRLETARRLDGGSLEAQVRLAYVNYMLLEVDKRGKRDAATVSEIIRQIESVKDQLPVADYLNEYLGDIAKLEGNDQDAMKYYRRALKVNPDNVRAKREVMLMEQRKNDAAAKGEVKKDASEEEEPTTFWGKVWKQIKAFLNHKL